MLQQGLQDDTARGGRSVSAVHRADRQLRPDAPEGLAVLEDAATSEIYSESKG